MAQNPKNPTKGSVAKLPTLPAPFEGNIIKTAASTAYPAPRREQAQHSLSKTASSR
jgi:hypothetical protein